ncbi:MAG: presenilin family intramembrane aspartyl protease PSH [Candidatus Thermoplasmatota archaeon]|nr:presenilin family intramembrane aspartyl protease PSH [Candidatus Thermoplasmatota archaeon]
MPDDETAREPQEGEAKRNFKPKQAVFPIAMMVVFIIVTVGLALYLAPFFDSMGFSSAFGEQAENPLWAFAFLGFMIIVAIGLLLLRKFLKKRKRNLKYLLAFAVFLSTIGVMTPLLDIIVNGAPPVWEDFEMDLENVVSAYPLDPENIDGSLVVLTNSSFHLLEKGLYVYEEKAVIEQMDDPFPLQYNSGLWVVGDRVGTSIHVRTIDMDGELKDHGMISHNRTGLIPTGVNIVPVTNTEEGTIEHLFLSFWENETEWSVSTSSLMEPSRITEWNEEIDSSSGPYHSAIGWSSGDTLVSTTIGLRELGFLKINDTVRINSSNEMNVAGLHWIKQIGDNAVFWTNDSSDPSVDGALGLIDTEWDREEIYTGNELDPSRVSYSKNGNKTEFLYIGEGRLHSIKGEDENEWSLFGYRSLYQFEPSGKILLTADDEIGIGKLEYRARGQTFILVLSFALSIGLIIALLKKPKWWLVDLGGLIMGAGVIALMGISFPILFTLLLLVLLAGYDAVAVYKTKHMIALADSVVEAKMPILLVFPMKWSYRYEDEIDLMGPKRKRESLFMGLGDVIIPGLFIVSISFFISPVGGARLFGLIYPPLGVSLFALCGMLLGYGILMRWVLKGKAHAGLPPLNGGTILGFLIGYLILYGTIVFW